MLMLKGSELGASVRLSAGVGVGTNVLHRMIEDGVCRPALGDCLWEMPLQGIAC